MTASAILDFYVSQTCCEVKKTFFNLQVSSKLAYFIVHNHQY